MIPNGCKNIFFIFVIYKLSDVVSVHILHCLLLGNVCTRILEYMNLKIKMTKFSHPIGFGLKMAGLPLIPVMVGEFCLCFIIDSGATTSLIDSSVAERLGELAGISDESSYILSINGNYREVKQSAILSFRIEEIQFTHTFLCESLHDALIKIEIENDIPVHGILGNDFLLKNRWIIDYEKLEIKQKN